MPSGCELRPIDLSDAAARAELLAVSRAAYAVEAELVGVRDLPPLRETDRELAASGESLLGAFDAEGLAGAIGWKRTPLELDVHRLVVAPRAFRRGVGRALLRTLLEREPAPRTVVMTAAANAPALALYASEGFAIERRRALPGEPELVALARAG